MARESLKYYSLKHDTLETGVPLSNNTLLIIIEEQLGHINLLILNSVPTGTKTLTI